MLADIDSEMVTYREEPDGATFKGPDGFLQAIAEWVEDFDEFVATAEELIDANECQVVVRVHQTATGSQSGAPIEGDFWFVHTLSDSKVTRLDMFASKEQGPRSRRAEGLGAGFSAPDRRVRRPRPAFLPTRWSSCVRRRCRAGRQGCSATSERVARRHL